jgi:hypothetical protein
VLNTAAETEMVEWISALEGSIAKIAKIVAGVDDSSSDGHHKSSSNSSREKHRSSSSRDRGGASDWASKVCRSVEWGWTVHTGGLVGLMQVVGDAVEQHFR